MSTPHALCKPARVGVVPGEPRDVVVAQRDEPGSGQHPDLPEPSAEHLPPPSRPGDHARVVAAEHGPGGSP